MGWQFWRRESGPQAVDATLRDLIVNRFDLTESDIGKLSMMQRAGNFSGRPVTRLRIYDPSMLNAEVSDVRKFVHLDTEAQAVCFEGHIEKGRPTNLNARGCMEETAKAA